MYPFCEFCCVVLIILCHFLCHCNMDIYIICRCNCSFNKIGYTKFILSLLVISQQTLIKTNLSYLIYIVVIVFPCATQMNLKKYVHKFPLFPDSSQIG